MDTSFTPETTTVAARARRNGIADLLHRTGAVTRQTCCGRR